MLNSRKSTNTFVDGAEEIVKFRHVVGSDWLEYINNDRAGRKDVFNP